MVGSVTFLMIEDYNQSFRRAKLIILMYDSLVL
ncbi:hypothetical protein MTCOM_05720 [Moorella thermoacetica]|nr:hypothetical protein MOOTH_24740 [Moorella thermoacetica]